MPMIPDPVGLVPFVGIKLLGYSAAGAYLRQTALWASEGDTPVIDVARAVGFGLTRTVLGLVCGAAYGVVASGLLPSGAGLPGMLLALAPLRALEWAVMLLLFFRAEARDRRFFWRGVLGGTLVSYLLDIPAWGVWSLFPRVGIC
jgi:hypothetical protein